MTIDIDGRACSDNYGDIYTSLSVCAVEESYAILRNRRGS
jgi:hypothetical protein